jgi:hypothetical protein
MKMKLSCNIDQQGSRVRGISGTILMVLAISMTLAAWFTGWNWLWWPIAGCGIGGAAQLFEAANSWCVIRAMGYKTRI